MALMKWREPNRAKYIGVRPAHDGVQIAKRATATNGESTIHTVTAGKTFYLVWVKLICGTAGVGETYLVWKSGATTILYLCDILVATPVGIISPDSAYFYPPMEIPFGDILSVISSAIAVTGIGEIFGWEE
jgi:hypothetical protein